MSQRTFSGQAMRDKVHGDAVLAIPRGIHGWGVLGATLLSAIMFLSTSAAQTVEPTVRVEEEVYRFEPANNGAGPMWCAGNTCIVRHDDQVFASALHTLSDVKPLNNCVPAILMRSDSGWSEVFRSEGLTREPSPLGVVTSGKVLMSENPTVTPRDTYAGPSKPRLVEFSPETQGTTPLEPVWQGEPRFTEHSYRSFALDATSGEMILLQNIGYTHAEWCFRDRHGAWSRAGKLHWPRAERDGDPIRICYPAVALKDRRVYFFGVSDVIEPNQAWRAYKHELTGREWDYVFRKLFFTWCDDLSTGEFHDWIEVANVEATGGSLFPNDLCVNSDGIVSVLWSETLMDSRLREAFSLEGEQRHALQFANIHDGKVVQRSSLLTLREKKDGLMPGRARFHVTPDGSVWIIYYVSGSVSGAPVSENRVARVSLNGRLSSIVSLHLKKPLTNFFTNTARAGCAPSYTLDLLGQVGNTMRYVQIGLPE